MTPQNKVALITGYGLIVEFNQRLIFYLKDFCLERKKKKLNNKIDFVCPLVESRCPSVLRHLADAVESRESFTAVASCGI